MIETDICSYIIYNSESIKDSDENIIKDFKNKLSLKKLDDAAFISYWVCRNIINGPSKELEDFILKSSKWSCYYSINILKERWLIAEPIIFSDLLFGCYYIKYVVKERLQEFEKLLLNGPPYMILHYILDSGVIKERWLEFENIIQNNDDECNDLLLNDYLKFFNIEKL